MARLSRLFPPAVSGVFLRMYPLAAAGRDNLSFEARSSLGRTRIRADRAERVSLWFAIRGYLEWPSIVIARTVCRPGDVVYDVGGNIGTETLPLAEIVGPSGVVECFEPLPENVRTLHEHIELNGARQIRVHPNAVADRAATLPFSPPATCVNRGEGYLDAQAGPGSIQVATVVLDDLLARGVIRPPRLIHMDVQGAELFVLRGARQMLTEARPVLILESAPPCLAVHGLKPSDVRDFLREQDYALFDVDRFGLSTALREDIITNWLALPARPDEQADQLARRIHRRIIRAALLPLIPGLNPAVLRCCAVALMEKGVRWWSTCPAGDIRLFGG
ncbi:MAG: FkbM family methyltransferase [Phycisphaerae bacterium]|nr:FkbM family methyltransferase [Phycisphaerae bacterium]